VTVPKTNYIHSRNGRIGGTGVDHGPADVDAILAAIKASGKERLVIHSHGGLVAKASALGIAETLMPVYSAGGYPLFFVWESGPWETIRNNLGDIAKEPIFQELVGKLLEYALGKVGAQAGTRSIAANAVDPEEVKARVRAFFNDPVGNPVPYADAKPLESRATRAVDPAIDENEIQMDLEQDADFVRALQSIADVPAATRGTAGVGAVQPQPTNMDPAVLAEIAPPQPDAPRGLFSMVSVSIRVAKVLAKIVKRFLDDRDHGFHATVVEEVLRGFYGDVIAKTFFWNQMKKDTQDAFGGDENVHAGTAFLARLKAAMGNGLSLERIFLVGHSTGGIYISHLVEAVDAMHFDPAVKFDVVLLAPANTHKLFDETIAKHGARIRWMRIFAMKDAVERNDGLLGDDWKRAFYPSSLLYFVSGLLEDEPDMPLVGMQRFNVGASFTAPEYPECDALRAWLGTPDHRLVWSIADDGDGRRSQSRKHGNFDNDPDTLAALSWIVAH
jgi:pimeloyl-ACP methyl ester carboxylesterase